MVSRGLGFILVPSFLEFSGSRVEGVVGLKRLSEASDHYQKMAQVKIVATMSTPALKYQSLGYRILDVQRYLWCQGQTACLGLARIAGEPRGLLGASFLDLISTLQGFEPGPGKTWVLTNLHQGDTWRPRQEVDNERLPGPTAPLGSARLSDGEVGFYRPDQAPEFLLMIHPWGSDALVLAQAVNAPSKETGDKTCQTPATVENALQCALCYRFLAGHELNQEPCLFHPGLKNCPSAWSSASETSDDVDMDLYPASLGDSEELDDLLHEEVFVYQCCGRRGDERGCTAETQHIPLLSEHAGKWRDSWGPRT